MRRGRRERTESGFTLVEMITSIVLMGIVIAPLGIAFTQAITLVPENKARTDAAIDRTFLLNRFSDDLANAQGFFWNVLPPPGEHVHGCPSDATGPAVLFFPHWDLDGAIYRARYEPASDATAVRVTRQPVVDGVTGAESDVLAGWCVPGVDDAPIEVHRIAPNSGDTGVPSEYERLRLIVRLRTQPDATVDAFDLEAALRVTP
ncbi:MAG: hypothetical protein KatS3mg010_1782 [Acidimicrobiia bacterium]|nr:MAG: hypothetical protein KatS3mg010_1782 [Acidimicrobiia bacterium]